ncbi:MAG: preprotein translocase subunit SecG [Dehalococcoidales bacterium]|jgi:preprotein translocase subunit SecG|nr:preprotein translocase subunit SecG [Dehalococcoidales bacterium]MCX6010801.1 preprotein translocase subunit SecG [Chloroflexota bacterium]
METYFSIAQIILSTALILAILLQVKGGGLGGIFGQADTVYRTKRGVEKTLFQLTIVLVVLFIVISIVALQVVS